MAKGLFFAVLAAAAALGASSAMAEMAGKYPLVSALPRPGATKILDNNRGTAWDVIYPPGMSTGMHRHPVDFVGVELVETMLKVTTPDGKERVSPIHRGQIYMLPKGLTHIEENVIGKPQRNSILIELKDAGPHDYANTGKEASGFAANGAKKVTDNNRVTLWDWTAGPSKSFFQTHDMYLVPMDAGILTVAGDQPSRALPVANGQVIFLPGGHTRTLQATGVRIAVVELK